MNKLKTKQHNHYEFDDALGFHLPTEKLPRNPVNTNPVKPKYNAKSVNHFSVPANISNRLEKIAAKHNTFNDTTEFNSPIIYPFMVNLSLPAFNITIKVINLFLYLGN